MTHAMPTIRSLFRASILLASLAVAGHALAAYPVTVQSCNRSVVFEHAPQHAVSNDVNLTEMMLALGLKSHMAGYTGISGWTKMNPALRLELKGLPELAKRYPSVEVLIGQGVDFYFAGWNYGMQVGGAVTPATLAPLGIAVYELSESCAHVMARPAASFDDVYTDLTNLGRIFDIEARANTVIDGMQTRLAKVAARIAPGTARVRVFVYDSGEDKPFTAGRLAMPTALIQAAGGKNIMDDLEQSWTRVSWESVVERNPQAIIIVDYGAVTAEQKMQFLLSQPALRDVDAIKHRRFIVIPYDEATPGIRNVDAVDTIAHALHPDVFQQ
jgi:iron complex transport system substrate-binding protein